MAIIDDLFTPSVSVSPSAWVPRISDDNGTPIGTSMVASRELKPGDPVTVKLIVNLSSPAVIEDIIDEEGNITLPIIGEFSLVGLTTADAERSIRKEYLDRQIYRNVEVNVISKAAQGAVEQAYSITGAIKSRGRHPIRPGMTLRQAIIAAGDVTDFAGDKIRITRNGITETFSYRKIKKGTIPDPIILHGDIIEVTD